MIFSQFEPHSFFLYRKPYVTFSSKISAAKSVPKKHDCYIVVVAYAAVDLPEVVATEAACMEENAVSLVPCCSWWINCGIVWPHSKNQASPV